MPVVTKVSSFSGGTLPIKYGNFAGEVVANHYFIDITAGQNAVNNIFDLGVLPAFHRVVDAVLIPDDLDTGTAAIALDVGLLDGTVGDAVNSRTCGAELFSADVAARTGVASRMSAITGFKLAPANTDRSIGVKIQAAPNVAAAGRIRLILNTIQDDVTVTF